MSNYIDFKGYSDSEILRMQREKKKEYIALIQSEKIAKKLLNYYNESLYTSNYHYRVNSEYYLLNERVTKKRLVGEQNEEDNIIKIPLSSIIARLEDSKNQLYKINPLLSSSYNIIVDEIINKIKGLNLSIFYKNGSLYLINSEDDVLVDDEIISALLDEENIKLKIKH